METIHFSLFLTEKILGLLLIKWLEIFYFSRIPVEKTWSLNADQILANSPLASEGLYILWSQTNRLIRTERCEMCVMIALLSKPLIALCHHMLIWFLAYVIYLHDTSFSFKRQCGFSADWEILLVSEEPFLLQRGKNLYLHSVSLLTAHKEIHVWQLWKKSDNNEFAFTVCISFDNWAWSL